jgi:hypothetical protein
LGDKELRQPGMKRSLSTVHLYRLKSSWKFTLLTGKSLREKKKSIRRIYTLKLWMDWKASGHLSLIIRPLNSSNLQRDSREID